MVGSWLKPVLAIEEDGEALCNLAVLAYTYFNASLCRCGNSFVIAETTSQEGSRFFDRSRPRIPID